jgi:hypothetical protein
MPMSVIAFLDQVLTEDVAAAVGPLATRMSELLPGARVEARDVTREEFRFRFSPGATPEMESPRPQLPWRMLLIASLPASATRAQAEVIAEDMHATLPALATCVVEGGSHFSREVEPVDWAYTIAVQQRKQGIDRDAFIHYYRSTYVPNAIAALDDPPFDSYSTSVVLSALGEFPWDGVTFNDYATDRDLEAHMREQVVAVARRNSDSQFVSVVEKYTGHRLVGAINES